MRPLDRIPSIKLKLGIVILAAVAVSAVVSTVGFAVGIPVWLRPVIAAALSLALVQVLSRGMTSPLREMARAAEAMAAGRAAPPITATSHDEVGQLAKAFNAMTAQLADVDRQRRDLVANVSHELRTPLGGLRAMLENLVDGVEPSGPDATRTMLRQAERLSRLVNQLLDLSRLEAGGIALHRRSFGVAELLRAVAGEAAVNTPGVPVEVVAEEGLVAHGDPERVHQVVGNLVENAARFSPPGAAVQVRASSEDDGSIRIEVADEGPGISPEDAERVFNRFYRADAARASSGDGAGLGLAIARWIVDLHGGRIQAEQRHPTGCRVVFTIPPTPAEAPSPGAAP